MANATSITLHALTVDTGKSDIVADVLDTGTAAVTLAMTPAGDTHNILLEFTNTAVAANAMTVAILAGDNPPAFLASAGDLTLTIAQNEVHYVCIDSARFMQDDGTIAVKSTPAATQTQTLQIKAIKLPK